MSEQLLLQEPNNLPGGPINADPYFAELRLQKEGRQGVSYYDEISDSYKYVGLGVGEELALIAGDNNEPRMPFIRKTDGQGQVVDVPFSDYLLVRQTPREGLDRELPETFRDNIGTLESKGELGTWFAGLYKAAVEEFPPLANIEVKPGGSADDPVLANTGGHAKHKYHTENDRYEIVVNTDDGIDHFKSLLTRRRISAEASAVKLGIEPCNITPEQLAAFIFLHELGHIFDSIKNAPDRATYEARRKKDMDRMPVKGFNPVQLIKFLESEDGQEWSKSEEVKRHYGFSTPEELLAKQEAAYHSIETEDIPDQFAAKVMRKLGMV